MLIAISVSNPISASDWTVIQSNIDGAVTAKFSTSDIGKIPVVDESNTLRIASGNSRLFVSEMKALLYRGGRAI